MPPLPLAGEGGGEGEPEVIDPLTLTLSRERERGPEAGGHGLEVDVSHRQGAFALEAAFTAGGGLTALFGRSGSGKTTLVNLLAGLLRPARGRIAVGGRALVDTGAGVFVPAHRRRLGYVFQDARLFPHLTVRRNLLYGRWLTPRAERWGSLPQVVALLGIGHLLDRRPAGLSGGERQRVAIGRALLASPRLLLMDEPLASLDAERKGEVLPYVERLRDELRLPIVYVTHSVEEVARLADTVVRLEAGRVAGVGPAGALLGALAGDAGGGRAEGPVAVLEARVAEPLNAHGLAVLAHPAGEFRLPGLDLPRGAAVRLKVWASDVALAPAGAPAPTSVRNRLRVRALAIEGEGPVALVRLDAGGEPLAARVTREAVAELGVAPGVELLALVKSAAVEAMPGRQGPEPPPGTPPAET